MKKKKISELKRGGVEKKTKSQLETKPKSRELGPVTTAMLQTLRIIFWGFLILILITGIFQLMRSKQPRIIEEIVRYELSESESDKAKAFAESFVKAYLTYGNEVNDKSYRADLLDYLNSAVSVGRPEYAAGSSEVISTKVYDLQKHDESSSDIVVQATVKITYHNDLKEKYDSETGERTSVPNVQIKKMYVSVPIKAKGGKVVVNDYPTFIKVSDKLDSDMDTYYGESFSTDSEKQSVKKFLEDFFGVYYSGTPGQIKTFFKEDPKIQGLQDEFRFSAIKSLEVYAEGSMYTAVVILEIKDTQLGAIFNQRKLLTLEKSGDRFLIISVKNRGK